MVEVQNSWVEASASLFAMPNEILNAVFASLHKEDVKSIRLLCHRFDDITLPILFDRVIVTSIVDNAGLFEYVINNPSMAQHVKTIVFDIPRFRDVNLAYYLQFLMLQTQQDVGRHLPDSALTQHPDVITTFVKEARDIRQSGAQNFAMIHAPEALVKSLEKAHWFRDPGRSHARVAVLKVFKQDLARHHEAHVAMRNDQNKLINKSLPRCVADVFRKCVNIQHVEVQTEWQPHVQPINDRLESILPHFPSSGRVARYYPRLLLRPSHPVRGGVVHQQFLLQLFDTLAGYAHQVRHVTLGKGFVIPMEGLHTVGAPGLPGHVADSFGRLTTLTLWLPSFSIPEALSVVDYLGPALKNARNLKHLQVGASNITKYEHFDTYRLSIFPLFKDCVLPDLVTLGLDGMVGSAKELLTFFEGHKRLKSLSLTSIDLRVHAPYAGENTAAQISEDLMYLFSNIRCIMSLTKFSIEPPFRTQTNEHEWGPIEDFVGFKSMWEKLVLHPDLPNPRSSSGWHVQL
ncbi:MAG: hypothetical protein Q9213_008116 [Squamulea squamosa]